ncbi:TPA: N-acetylmuramoyl-L-alanine amidase [Photobacterium damselae]
MKKLYLLTMLFLPTVTFANSELNSFNAVLIDPAHGGKDPGGIGINNLEEKTLTLNFAKQLAEQLQSKFYVKLLRNDDTYIDYNKRLQVNVPYNALKVIIHTPVSENSNDKGLSIEVNPKFRTKKEIREILHKNNLNAKISENSTLPLNTIFMELGYISNQDDIKTITNNRYQQAIAQFINEIS